MSLPASFARVLGMLRRISPPWPFTDADTSVGAEIGSIAVAIGMATDPLDGVLDEVFPDTTTQLLPRWETITRIPTRTGDDIAVRRARVLAVLRRTSGPRLDQLAKMLSGPLGIDAGDMQFFEPLRSMIEDAITQSTGTISIALTPTPTLFTFGKPWPGVVDDAGVSVYLDLDVLDGQIVTVTAPTGATWMFSPTVNQDWTRNRTAFTGAVAGGAWSVSVSDATSVSHIRKVRLLVSNDVDSGQIYSFFVLRDPTLPGVADLGEAQRLFHRTALANMRSFVIENMAFAVGDSHSLCGRDPVGV